MAMPSLVAWFCNQVRVHSVAPQRPNILIVLVDGADVGNFGACCNETVTPHIDSLAAEGLSFSNFHAASNGKATRMMLQSGVDPFPPVAARSAWSSLTPRRATQAYKVYLSNRMHSLGQLMRDGAYITQCSGK
jgi:arylsulfatase